MQVLQLLEHILKLHLQPRVILPEHRERLLPLVREIRVQRLIVKRRHHLRHRLLRIRPADHRRPRLLRRRLQLGNEMLPLHRQLLVAPRHLHVPRRQIRPVLPHHRHPQREPAPHPLIHLLPHLHLRQPKLRPKPLQHLVPMLDLDERPPLLVTRPPQRHEHIPRLQRPLRRRHQIRNPHRETLVVEPEHHQLHLRRHLLSKTILRLQHRPVRPRAEFKSERRLASPVRRKIALRRELPEFP